MYADNDSELDAPCTWSTHEFLNLITDFDPDDNDNKEISSVRKEDLDTPSKNEACDTQILT